MTTFFITGFESMLWHVPVTIATSNNPSAMKFVLNKRLDTITVEGVGPNDWILVSKLGIIVVSTTVCLWLTHLSPLN